MCHKLRLVRWPPDGSFTIASEANKPIVTTLKGVGINLAELPTEALHILEDEVIVELTAHEQHVLQVISEKKVNNNQLVVQRDSVVQIVTELTDKNQHIIKVLDEVY